MTTRDSINRLSGGNRGLLSTAAVVAEVDGGITNIASN